MITRDEAGDDDVPTVTPTPTPAPAPVPSIPPATDNGETLAPAESPNAVAGDGTAPAAPAPAPTPSPAPVPSIPVTDNDTDSTAIDDSEDSSTSVIALAVLLAAALVGNAMCCFLFMRKKKSLPASHVRGSSHADAELGRLQNDLAAEKSELAAEKDRRVRAEALINRTRGGGIRVGDFPSVRDVDRHVEDLANYAITWAEKACAIGGSHSALPETIESVLENTFKVCRDEVKQCLDEKLENLSAFLGSNEPVVLSGGDSMNLDTQYVLYECLCKNYRTIVSTEPNHMEELANEVSQLCEAPADESLVGGIIFGDAWPLFDELMQNYILVFVEMALQNPRMDFQDDVGLSTTFNAEIHRDWAPHTQVPVGRLCCIVFPTVQQQEGRPRSHAKTGVVRIPENAPGMANM
ncbi:unnamed protein product [Pylaiella littoralis]